MTDDTLNHNLDAAYAMREALRAKIVECRPAIIGDRFGDGQAYTVRRLLDALDAEWLTAWHAAHGVTAAPRCTHCQKEPGTLATPFGLRCLPCYTAAMEAANVDAPADRLCAGGGGLGDPAGADAEPVSGGGLRDSGDHSVADPVPDPGGRQLPGLAPVEDDEPRQTYINWLREVSRGEWITGSLYDDPDKDVLMAAARAGADALDVPLTCDAALVWRLTVERDQALEEMAAVTAERDAAIESARAALARVTILEGLVLALSGTDV